MSPSLAPRTLASLLAVAALFAAAPADARFGKKSEPAKSGEKKDKVVQGGGSSKAQSSRPPPSSGPGHRASSVQAQPRHSASAVPARSRPSHRATVVQTPDYEYQDRGHHHVHVHDSYCGHGVVVVQPAPVYGYGYREPAQTYVAPGPSQPAQERFELGGTVQPMAGGAILGLAARFDWQRWGLDGRFDNVLLLSEGGFDSIKLLNADLTLSLLSGEHGRLRAHLGLHSAFAPDAAFVGPGLGASVSLNLFGPFTADAGASLVAYPFGKLDSYAALGLRLGIVEARGGVRLTILDDQGRVDGVRNTEALVGPYLGLALVL